MKPNFFKTTKWWMYLPFACLTLPLINWVVSPTLQTERVKRVLFIFVNIYWTLMIVLFVLALLLKK